ncbi:hypothetical protein V495_03436 [Pseudogymnoascus sp. VKM F-4514 (FW-929)]|nr:hypothetical protein V490_04737 [Pseudogymnoascus sp. VKM F-3557]KFY44485.1 hypothetical protein V495_03436 [Pseudogymnoascus sp. VKM F-4514 (FW-929)]KFY58886.1 hypothetical protein V497_04602 [Pseudogymnoascus sp. VKM F-4516 (FW-969)]
MQFQIIALASFLAVAFAAPAVQSGEKVVVRAPYPAVLSEAAAMSNADGEVIPFSSAEVHQPLKAAGK